MFYKRDATPQQVIDEEFQDLKVPDRGENCLSLSELNKIGADLVGKLSSINLPHVSSEQAASSTVGEAHIKNLLEALNLDSIILEHVKQCPLCRAQIYRLLNFADDEIGANSELSDEQA